MKKVIYTLALVLSFCASANAESIVVIDGEGRVVRQMYTAPTTYEAPVTTVTTAAPTVTVVRESPVVQNSYYYDSGVTNAAWAAGVTTAVLGGLIYHGFRPHHGHRPHGGHGPHFGGGKPPHGGHGPKPRR